MKVHSAIARVLRDGGVECLFGLAGDGNLYLVDSYARELSGRYIAAIHEAGVVTMALGYAVTSGRIGVGTVTYGPGVINTLTGLTEGARARIPILLVCGDTATDDRLGSPNINQRAFIEATGAGFEQVRSPATVCEDVAYALRRAAVERRPIALNVPVDFQWLDTSYEYVPYYVAERRVLPPVATDIENAGGIVAGARRPLILAGRGAITDGARDAILRLARRIDAPVATTLKGSGLFRGDARDIGFFGTLSSPRAVDVIAASDCVIAFGAGLNKFTTANGALLRGKRVIQVDIEPEHVGRRSRVDVGIVGDTELVANLLGELLDEAEIPPSGFFQEVAATVAPDLPASPVGDDPSAPIAIEQALDAVDRALPAERIIVTDGGRFLVEAWKRLNVTRPSDFIGTNHCGSFGLGMGYGIGAAAARTDRPTVVVCGDGGFMHAGLTEMNTAVRNRLDLIVVVCNDGCYGAEHAQYVARGIDPALSFFEWPDLGGLAAAAGFDAVTVGTVAELGLVDAAIARRSRPLLIDLKLDPAQISFT